MEELLQDPPPPGGPDESLRVGLDQLVALGGQALAQVVPLQHSDGGVLTSGVLLSPPASLYLGRKTLQLSPTSAELIDPFRQFANQITLPVTPRYLLEGIPNLHQDSPRMRLLVCL